MICASIASHRAYQDLDFLVEACFEYRCQIANIRAFTTGHFVQAKFIWSTIRGSAINNYGLGLVFLDTIPEMVELEPVAKHGIGRQDVEFASHFGVLVRLQDCSFDLRRGAAEGTYIITLDKMLSLRRFLPRIVSCEFGFQHADFVPALFAIGSAAECTDGKMPKMRVWRSRPFGQCRTWVHIRTADLLTGTIDAACCFAWAEIWWPDERYVYDAVLTSHNAAINTTTANMDFLPASAIVRRCFHQLGFILLESANSNTKPVSDRSRVGNTRDFPLRPQFEELPLEAGDPKASAWGLWGQSDEIGTLNLITPEVVRLAQQEIVAGLIVPLK